jgi:hypothetical protein
MTLKEIKELFLLIIIEATDNNLQDFAIVKAVAIINNVVGSTVSGIILQGDINIPYAALLLIILE